MCRGAAACLRAAVREGKQTEKEGRRRWVERGSRWRINVLYAGKKTTGVERDKKVVAVKERKRKKDINRETNKHT